MLPPFPFHHLRFEKHFLCFCSCFVLLSFILSHSSAWAVLKAGCGDKRQDLRLALSPVLSVGIELINALLVNGANKRVEPEPVRHGTLCVCCLSGDQMSPLFHNEDIKKKSVM